MIIELVFANYQDIEKILSFEVEYVSNRNNVTIIKTIYGNFVILYDEK